jgi:hypothetical protein
VLSVIVVVVFAGWLQAVMDNIQAGNSIALKVLKIAFIRWIN